MRNRSAALVVLALFAAACGEDASGPEAAAEAKLKAKWADEMGDLPFVVGVAKGMRVAEATKRPPMFFYTATW
jgi:hypothetical protein